MSPKALKDRELLSKIKSLVQDERHLLTQTLEHLREVERRRLYSDLGCASLFEYCVKELGYSEGGAGRRIQAMRLIREIPEVKSKIEEGKISLSNLSQAQSYFREAKKSESLLPIRNIEKIKIIESLENKSAREGQKILLSLQPERSLPRERERLITPAHTEVSFILSAVLKEKLEELRSLLGTKGSSMSLAQLVEQMADLSLSQIKAKRFGKKLTEESELKNTPTQKLCSLFFTSSAQIESSPLTDPIPKVPPMRPATHAKETAHLTGSRAISRKVRFQVWQRDHGRCTCCGSQRNINFDHIQPVGLGGRSTAENLRLLCFQCNQRAAIKTYGLDKILQHQEQLRQSELA